MKGASQIAPLGIRLPDELKEKIKERAKINGRSVNSEIVQILEDFLAKDDQGLSQVDQLTIAAYEEQVSTLERIISAQKTAFELATEQIALLKQHIKNATGFDVQEYFNKTVDYEAIRKNLQEKHGKKPT
ncbi:Arc family DNA-binding protein [Citrobacter freundii complex sp. 2024EL-00238]|uniref:Arc family DNA-binding protein n=1 Tax=Citrobacter freundii complex TaxID=1344959 RepID=UPI0018A8877D|nr:Arc family DNA-binding protein [Citrobacter freundii]ELS0846318.1 Arc family DNA-binding protein [Citrobacter freundii]HAU5661415.1 Arc family DNA-binding protein [Citrobacter freundii]HBV0977975.1 Arc family DNA-binding protein [Citrobacter freundii]HCB2472256.1 Arc family DNA-binding protein [Citrobacter freundii]